MDENALRREVEAAGLEQAFAACPGDVAAALLAAAALKARLVPVGEPEIVPWPSQDPAE